MGLCSEDISSDEFKVIMAGLETTLTGNGNETCRLQVNPINIKEEYEILDNVQKLMKEQSMDLEISFIINCIKKPSESKDDIKLSRSDSEILKVLKRGVQKLKMNKDGLLTRQVKDGRKLVLPKSMQPLIYDYLHISHEKAQLESILTSAPMELISIDYVKLVKLVGWSIF